MDEYDLTAVDLCYCSSIHFTYKNTNGTVKSWLDHILTIRSFASCFLDVLKLSVACNLSDHSPLSFCLTFQPATCFMSLLNHLSVFP